MSPARLSSPFVCALALAIPVSAGSHHEGSHAPRARIPAAVGGGWAGFGFPYYQTVGPNGLPISYVPPFLVAYYPGGIFPMFGPPPMVFPPGWRGIAGPLPPVGVVPPPAAPELAKPKKADPTRAKQLVTFGDRLFRAGNYHRAAERYEQAVRADLHSAAPRVRLAQIALVRGQFAEAAHQLREAQTAEPGWLTKASDIQSIYAEPGDFAKQIAKLESHLQAQPHDRDAWLVLGAQWFLSGRTEKAADVFLRLTDRQPDATLAAFLDASDPLHRAR
jgi:hypothetical protein